jgi:hypothetical protein
MPAIAANPAHRQASTALSTTRYEADGALTTGTLLL